MILVTAANGRTGRRVVQALALNGHRVRAFDIATDVEQLLDQGAAEALVGDLLDVRDRRRAVEGAQAVVHIGPPMHPREVEMGHGIVSAARQAEVEHFVQFSVTHPQLEPLLNHQAKLAVERVVLQSRMPFTILQPMHYMQNIDVARAVADGVLRQPYALAARLAHVDLLERPRRAPRRTAFATGVSPTSGMRISTSASRPRMDVCPSPVAGAGVARRERPTRNRPLPLEVLLGVARSGYRLARTVYDLVEELVLRVNQPLGHLEGRVGDLLSL